MEKNLFNLLLANVQKSPDKAAYKLEDSVVTYQQVASLSVAFSCYLQDLGIKRATHVGVISNNSLEFALLFWAAARLGAVLVPLMPSYPRETIQGLCQAADIEVVLVEQNFPENRMTDLAGLKVFSFPGIDLLLRQSESFVVTESTIPADAPYIITLTSGSTSLPKPIVLSQASKVTRAVDGAKDVYGLSENDVTIVSTPMFHSMGMRMSLLPLLIGATGVIPLRFSPESWSETVRREGVTFAIVVSNQIEAVLDYLEKENSTIQSVKKLVSSSYTLKPKTKQRFLEKVPCHLYECYGTSEIGIATSIEFEKDGTKLTSVGEPLPYVGVKILSDQDQPLPTGQEGEIVVKTKTLFGGYYKNEAATKDAFWGKYFRTGDIGVLDEDGFLYYLGRKKDMIKYGAISLYPADIENALLKFDGVKECAVVGVEDKYLGEVPLAGVIASEGIQKKDLRRFCFEHLADYQVPVDFIFIDEIPRSALGKIQKFKLKKQLEELYKNKRMQVA